MDSKYRTIHDPSPLWNLHCALWAYVTQTESAGVDIPDDLCVVVSVDMHSYMVRYYKSASFEVRGVPVVAGNLCPSTRIHFLARSEFEMVRENAEYWK